MLLRNMSRTMRSDCTLKRKYQGNIRSWLCTVILLLVFPKDVFTTSSCPDCTGVNVTCTEDICLPRCVNVTSSGECHQCRDSRFYGKQCENVCPHTCLNSTCQLIDSRLECTKGCVAGKKGDNCRVNCPKGCTQCERYSDLCVGPCSSSNYYGDRCDTLCPSNCKEGCNRTGHCYSCMHGFRGSFCDVACPTTCINCEQYTDNCTYDCPNIGYFGNDCSQPCHGHCRGGCDNTTGVCDYCADGYSGRYCNLTCFSTCIQCDRYGDRCVGQCARLQYYGDHCDKMCSVNCTNGCDRDTEECNGCTPGQRGRYCNKACPDGCADGCARVTGECNSCKSGLIGRYCNETCPDGCVNECHRDTGECNSCQSGKMGIYCNESCPSNCICDRGTACDSCKSGYRGMHCNELCPSNCTCDRYKNICIGPCPNNAYGEDCSIPCPYACNGCDKTSGVCNTCNSGYHRTYCDEMCSRCTGEMTNCYSDKCIIRIQLILKILFGVLALVLVAATVLIVYKNRRRCVKSNGQEQPKAESNYSDQTQYWSTKYWEIKDEDVESDSFTNRGLHPRQGLECPTVSFREEIPLQGQYVTVRDQRPMGEPCPTGSVLADAYSVLENTLYKSSGASAACASRDQDMVGVSTSLDLSDEDVQTRGHRRLIWTDKDGSEVSVTSEDLRLTRKTDSMLLWEQNTDFSQVYVKYITPNSPACK